MKEILKDMESTPDTYRDLELEDDLFGAIKQLLGWEPPPKWERSRSRYDACMCSLRKYSLDWRTATKRSTC